MLSSVCETRLNLILVESKPSVLDKVSALSPRVVILLALTLEGDEVLILFFPCDCDRLV